MMAGFEQFLSFDIEKESPIYGQCHRYDWRIQSFNQNYDMKRYEVFGIVSLWKL